MTTYEPVVLCTVCNTSMQDNAYNRDYHQNNWHTDAKPAQYLPQTVYVIKSGNDIDYRTYSKAQAEAFIRQMIRTGRSYSVEEKGN